MYNKGDLRIIKKPCESTKEEDGFLFCDDSYEDGWPHVHQLTSDYRENDYNLDLRYPTVYLDHSCDEWVIGGVDQIKTLISDLQDALTSFE